MSTGLFSSATRQIYDLASHDQETLDAGVTDIVRSAILPYAPYQILMAKNLPQMSEVRRYVVGDDGMLLRNV